MTRDDVVALLRRHQDALNRHDVDALTALYVDDAVIESPMFDAVRGREAIRQSFERLFTVFPDYAVSLSDADFLSDGERAATFGTVTATHSVELFGLPPTGQRIVYHAARLYTLRRGTIARERRLYDFRGVLERLEKTRLDRELVLASAVQNALCRSAHGGAFFDAVSASLPSADVGAQIAPIWLACRSARIDRGPIVRAKFSAASCLSVAGIARVFASPLSAARVCR